VGISENCKSAFTQAIAKIDRVGNLFLSFVDLVLLFQQQSHFINKI
jgi:hypothetical protein